jgi:hypothetical protein
MCSAVLPAGWLTGLEATLGANVAELMLAPLRSRARTARGWQRNKHSQTIRSAASACCAAAADE